GYGSRRNASSAHLFFGLQCSAVSIDLLAVFLIEVEEFDAQPEAFARIANPRHGDDAMVIGQLEAHDHARADADRLFGRDEHAAKADVGQVAAHARRAAAAVGQFIFDLRSDRGALESPTLQLRGTLHNPPWLRRLRAVVIHKPGFCLRLASRRRGSKPDGPRPPERTITQ